MRTKACFGFAWGLLALAASAVAEEPYPIVYNFQFVPAYEYVNSMAMSENNKDYYAVFIMVFQNKGNIRLPLNDEYEILTSKGERHKPGFHPLVARDVEARRNFKAVSGKVKFIEPGQTVYTVQVFDTISDGTPAFQFRVRGLPSLDGQPDQEEIVAEFEHLPKTVMNNSPPAKDPTIIWESANDPGNPRLQLARWRLKSKGLHHQE